MRLVSSFLVASGLVGCVASAPHVTAPRPGAGKPAAPTAITATQPADDVPADAEVFRLGTRAALVPKVVVLDAGGPERTRLRLAGDGHWTQVEGVLRQSSDFTPSSSSDGATELDMTLRAASAVEDGMVQVHFEVTDAHVTSTGIGVTKDNALGRGATAIGAELTILLTDRGQALGHVARGGSDAATTEELARLLTQAIAVPLPSEPVGVGARWRTRELVAMSPLTAVASVEEVTYQLTSLEHDGALATIDMSVRREALSDRGAFLSAKAEDEPRGWRAMSRVTATSLDQIGAGKNPHVHGEAGAVLLLAAPQLSAHARATTLEMDGKLHPPDGAAPTPVHMSIREEATLRIADAPPAP
jgi:hypothetical protein